MERINVTDNVRIGLLQTYVAVYRPGQVIIDPDTGGIVPTDPVLVCKMFAGVEPLIGRPLLEQLVEGDLVNRVDAVVTCWYREDLTVAMYLEFEVAHLPRHLEILDIRDRQFGHRYLELYCQERVA
jgi:hypothetical protein